MNPKPCYTRLPGTPHPRHYWQGEGVRIAADSWGPAEGPLVVLQHGAGQTRHAWKGTGQALGAAGFHAVAFDARGHGDSDWDPEGRYSQDLMVRDLQCVIAALGQQSAVLVGASMGGGTSLVAAGEGHVDTAALVLVDVAPNIESAGVANIQAFMNQRPEGFDSLEEVAAAIASYQPHRPTPRKLDGLAKNVRLGPEGRYHWHWDPHIMEKTRDLGRRTARLEACARNLRVPTLLVRGGLSDLLSEEGAQAFLALCPHSEYVRVSDAAHMVVGDRNDVFATAVIDFLRRRVSTRREGERTGATAPNAALDDDLLDTP